MSSIITLWYTPPLGLISWIHFILHRNFVAMTTSDKISDTRFSDARTMKISSRATRVECFQIFNQTFIAINSNRFASIIIETYRILK